MTEQDLDFKAFRCCGDEDLYPFRCPNDGRCMVFCYECDTLYWDLSDTSNSRHDVNHFDPDRPSFACPSCGFEFEYHFMANPAYRATHSSWVEEGHAALLTESGF